jgi:hypothetical protein
MALSNGQGIGYLVGTGGVKACDGFVQWTRNRIFDPLDGLHTFGSQFEID